MNSKINPNVEVGDRIVCITMYGESSVSYRDSGEVTGFGDDISGVQIKVKWDNGSTLPLIKENDAKNQRDSWMLEKDFEESLSRRRKSIQEATSIGQLSDDTEVVRYFNQSKVKKYLDLLKKSSVTNMFGASPYLYMGKDILRKEHYREDSEEFENVLEMADEIKNVLISGSMRLLDEKDVEITPESVSRTIRKYAPKILSFWMRHH